jgi:hypothetical protein
MTLWSQITLATSFNLAYSPSRNVIPFLVGTTSVWLGGSQCYVVNDICYNAGLVNDIVYTVILACVCQWIHFIFLCIKVCVILTVFFIL